MTRPTPSVKPTQQKQAPNTSQSKPPEQPQPNWVEVYLKEIFTQSGVVLPPLLNFPETVAYPNGEIKVTYRVLRDAQADLEPKLLTFKKAVLALQNFRAVHKLKRECKQPNLYKALFLKVLAVVLESNINAQLLAGLTTYLQQQHHQARREYMEDFQQRFSTILQGDVDQEETILKITAKHPSNQFLGRAVMMNRSNLLYTVGAIALTAWFIWSLVADKPTTYDPITHCQAGKAQPTITVLIDPSTPPEGH